MLRMHKFQPQLNKQEQKQAAAKATAICEAKDVLHTTHGELTVTQSHSLTAGFATAAGLSIGSSQQQHHQHQRHQQRYYGTTPNIVIGSIIFQGSTLARRAPFL